MSTLRLSTIQNLAGVEVYTAKAWVNFNGTGTVAIRAAGNVSSITDNGVGNYTVNFTAAMSDANYAVTGMVRNDNTNGNRGAGGVQIYHGSTPTASAFQVLTAYGATATSDGAPDDVPFACLAVFR